MNRQWIIHSVAVHHLMWGVLLWFSPATCGVTSITLLCQVAPVWLLSPALIIVSVGVWLMMWVNNGAHTLSSRQWWAEAVFLMVQQYFLLYAVLGSVKAVLHAEYLDGTPAFWGHILGDQLLYFIWAGVHTIALWDKFSAPFLLHLKRKRGERRLARLI